MNISTVTFHINNVYLCILCHRGYFWIAMMFGVESGISSHHSDSLCSIVTVGGSDNEWYKTGRWPWCLEPLGPAATLSPQTCHVAVTLSTTPLLTTGQAGGMSSFHTLSPDLSHSCYTQYYSTTDHWSSGRDVQLPLPRVQLSKLTTAPLITALHNPDEG